MKNLFFSLLLLWPITCEAQIFASVPYTFSPNTQANASQVMSNFNAIVSNGNVVSTFLASKIAAVTPPPPGTIMFFFLTSCPLGWTTQSVWVELYIRGLDLGRGLDPNNTLGQIESQQLQSHKHSTNALASSVNTNTFEDSGGVLGSLGVALFTTNPSTGDAITSVGEVRPKTKNLMLCKKD